MAEKVARALGVPLPDMWGSPVRIVGRTEEEVPRGRVIKAQGWLEGLLQQQLVVINPPLADQEDMLEGVCWLLANRHVIARQSMNERIDKLGATPDWFSDGLAQTLFPELRARDAAAVKLRWKMGQPMSVAEIMAKERLPEGRWSEKYVCGIFVGWLLQRRERDAGLNELFDRWADGDSAGPAVLVRRWEDIPDEEALESAWGDWVERETRVEREVGLVSRAHLAALKELTVAAHSELEALARTDDVQHLSAEAGRRMEELQRLSMGRSQAFRSIVGEYIAYLLALLENPAAPGGAEQSDPRNVLGLLERADRAAYEYLRATDEHRQFLDDVEARLAAGVTNQNPRTAAYLDRLEGTRSASHPAEAAP